MADRADSRSTSSTGPTSCFATTSRCRHTSIPTAWRSPRCAACSVRCWGCSSRAPRTWAWPPITSSSRSATTSGSGTRRARAWTRSCWPSSRCWKTPSARSASRCGPMVELEADDALASAARGRPRRRPRRAGVHLHPRQGPRAVRRGPEGRAARPPPGAQLIDEAGVRERFGVGPRSIPDYLALVGDSADGFPGLPGWGAKSTATVLARYEHLDAIPDDVREWDGRRARRGEAGGDAGRGARRGRAVPRSRHAAHRRRRRRRRRLGVARRRRRSSRRGRSGSAPRTSWSAPSGWRGSGSADGGARARRRSVPVLGAIADGPRRRRAGAAAARLPGDVVRVAHQLAALGAAGYRAVAPDQRGYARGARPADARPTTASSTSSPTSWASPTRSAPTGSTSSATTGAASWPGTPRRRIRSRLAHADRRVHAAPGAVPGRDAPAAATSASVRATWSGSGRPTRKRRSSPTTPRSLPRRVRGPPAGRRRRVPAGVHRRRRRRAHRRVELVPRQRLPRPRTVPITAPTLYVWSTGDVALGREAAEGTAAEVSGPYRFEVLEDVSHWIPEEAAGHPRRPAPGPPGVDAIRLTVTPPPYRGRHGSAARRPRHRGPRRRGGARGRAGPRRPAAGGARGADRVGGARGGRGAVVGRSGGARRRGRPAGAHEPGDARRASAGSVRRSSPGPGSAIDQQVADDARRAGPPHRRAARSRARASRARRRARAASSARRAARPRCSPRPPSRSARRCRARPHAGSGASAWPKTCCVSPASSTASTTDATSPCPARAASPTTRSCCRRACRCTWTSSSRSTTTCAISTRPPTSSASGTARSSSRTCACG